MQANPKKCVSLFVSVPIGPYNARHIRPLAVSPLNHPESVPNPWGFCFSGRRGQTLPRLASRWRG
jgi:hypothetical protein